MSKRQRLDRWPFEMPKPKVMISLEQVTSLQGHFRDAEGQRVHFEHYLVRRAVGRSLMQTGPTCSYVEAVAVRNVACEQVGNV